MLDQIKNFFTGGNRPVEWDEIPACLRKKIGVWIFLAGAVFLVNLLIFGYFGSTGMLRTGVILGGFMFGIGLYTYFLCRYQNYAIYSGIVRGVYRTGLFWKNTTVVIDCDGDCIQFIVRERQSMFKEGLPVTIYIPRYAQRSKTIGDMAFHEYLAVEPHRKISP